MKYLLVPFIIVCAMTISCSSSKETTSNTPTTQTETIIKQGEGSDRERIQQFMQQQEELKNAIGLRPEQDEAFTKVGIKYVKEFSTLRNQDGNRRSKMMKMRDVMQRRNAEIEAILDEDQYAKYQEYMEKNREQMRSRF